MLPLLHFILLHLFLFSPPLLPFFCLPSSSSSPKSSSSFHSISISSSSSLPSYFSSSSWCRSSHFSDSSSSSSTPSSSSSYPLEPSELAATRRPIRGSIQRERGHYWLMSRRVRWGEIEAFIPATVDACLAPAPPSLASTRSLFLSHESSLPEREINLWIQIHIDDYYKEAAAPAPQCECVSPCGCVCLRASARWQIVTIDYVELHL